MRNLIPKCTLLLVFVMGMTTASFANTDVPPVERHTINFGESISLVVKDKFDNLVTEVEIWQNGNLIFTSASGRFSLIPSYPGLWICEARKNGVVIRKYEITVIDSRSPNFASNIDNKLKTVYIKEFSNRIYTSNRKAVLKKYS